MRPSTRCSRPILGSLALTFALLGSVISPVAATYPGTTNGKLAFAMRDADGNAQINVAEPDGSGLKALTTGAYFHACAAWSADGSKIAYCSNESGPFEIWTMNQDGSGQAQLTKLGGSALWPDFSPDGTLIAFDGTQGTDAQSQIRTVDTATGATVSVLTSCATDKPTCSNTYPAWSPDGTHIAFIHVDAVDADGNATGTEVWVMDADGGDAHPLTSDGTPKDQLPDWSPDGTQIAFEEIGSSGTGGIWVMNADGSDPHQVAGCTSTDPKPCASGDLFGPAWSPDGQQIAYVSHLADATDRPVMVMNADGSNAHRLTAAKGVLFVPGWQPIGAPSSNGSPGASAAPQSTSQQETATPDALSAPAVLMETVTLPMPAPDAPAIVAFGSIWFPHTETGTLTRWDPFARRVVETLQIGDPSRAPYGDPKAVVASSDTVFVASPGTGSIARIDPAANRVGDAIELGDFAALALFIDGDSLWAADFDAGLVERIDTRTGRVLATLPGIPQVVGLAGGFGAIWANSDTGSLVKIDPATNTVAKTFDRPGGAGTVAVGGDALWSDSVRPTPHPSSAP